MGSIAIIARKICFHPVKLHTIYRYGRERGLSRVSAMSHIVLRTIESASRKLRRQNNPIYMEMDRPTMEKLPPVPALSNGFTLRTYRKGDEEGLARIYAACWLDAVTPAEVRKKVIENSFFKPERVFVIEHKGTPVATGVAYGYESEPDVGNGRMLGVLPECRGHRLGEVITLAIMHYFKDNGYKCVRYATNSWRCPALRIFLKLGFSPLLKAASDRARWEAITQRLGRPEAMERAKVTG